MRTVYSNIRKLERDIERVKMLHSLKRVTHDAAKQEVRRLEEQLMGHVALLSAHEQHIYLLRKEFGKEF
ncbi:MAG: coiled-coil [archaeon GW2011_AR5]|nr:MAG: coiled-coil [archaeon GW2011_AR5]